MPQDWFSQNAPSASTPPPTGGDWFSTNAPASTASQPTNWDKAKQFGAEFWNSLPGIGSAHEIASAVNDWASRKMDPNNPKMLSPTATFGTGVARDVSGLVKGATSPTGVATAAAAIAAPEIVGPALIAHGVYSGVKGWGDLKNPDVLQGELNAGAEAIGGAALTGQTVKAGGGPITQTIRQNAVTNAATKAPAEAFDNFQKAIPPMKSAPYSQADWRAAKPYLDAEHASNPVQEITDFRDNADSAISKIEDQIGQKINSLPSMRFKTNITQDVTNALKQNARGQSFVDAGLKDLEDFNFDQPKTLANADAIRRQLNLENQATLAKNNYKLAATRASDPAFAAREAAAESLRDGIYDQLAANGMPEARALRLDEGSLIKLRNAAQNQILNGEKTVRASVPNTPLRRIGAGVTKLAGTGIGAQIAGPAGAIAGSTAGEIAARAFVPQALTRNALIEKAFQ